MICPVGLSPALDVVHYAASALYMVDHFVLLAYFGVHTPSLRFAPQDTVLGPQES